MLLEQFQYSVHIAFTGHHADCHIEIRIDKSELPLSPIEPEAADRVAPHMQSITCRCICQPAFRIIIRNMETSGIFRKVPIKKLFSFPTSFVKIE